MCRLYRLSARFSMIVFAVLCMKQLILSPIMFILLVSNEALYNQINKQMIYDI